mgnify:CR=1 FL=1
MDKKKKDALESYGKNLGLAFQIADDALDYFAKEILKVDKFADQIKFAKGGGEAMSIATRLARAYSNKDEIAVRKRRHQLNIHPKYRMVDSCAAEFAAVTPYYLSLIHI